MSPTIKIANDLHQDLGRFGNRDETWNDVIARVLEHLDEDAALEDRDDRTTTHTADTRTAGKSGLERLDDGTVVIHRYQRGEYKDQHVEATVKGDGLSVTGDSEEIRTPTGAARIADKLHRGEDARGEGYNGWRWWKYETDEGDWEPIEALGT